MSTKARKSAASNGMDAISSAGEQIRNAWYTAKEAIRTKNGHYFVWFVKFLLSFVTLLYFKGVVQQAYYSMFYRLEIPEEQRGKYCFLVSIVCIFFGAVMLFTRRQLITKLVIMCSLPFYFPIILFNYKQLVLLVPLCIMIVITYLASGTSEGPKTIFGAIFLMLYVLGTFVFMTVQSILQPAIEETIIERGVTPNGAYRYSIVQVLDQGDGNTYVSIEPNTADIEYAHSKWYAKGFTHEIYRRRPLCEFKIEWVTQSRAEITRELIKTNPNTVFTLDADQMRLLGLNVGYAEEVLVSTLSPSQRHKLGYGLQSDMVDSILSRVKRLTMLDADQEKEFTVPLDFDKMVEIGLNPTYELRLSRMTDENLAALGVPEENEVLLVDGKVVFRQYVAELERAFWESSRDLTAFLESNDVPEVHPEGVEIPVIETTTTTVATTTTTTTTEETTTTEAPMWVW